VSTDTSDIVDETKGADDDGHRPSAPSSRGLEDAGRLERRRLRIQARPADAVIDEFLVAPEQARGSVAESG
jgi:hypothetical protein